MSRGGNNKGGRDRKGGLSPEDRALWDKFTNAVTPVDSKPRVAVVPRRSDLNADSRETIPLKPDGSRKKNTKPVVPAPRLDDRARPRSAGPAPAPLPVSEAGFDRKLAKKLGKGQREIDARIDLHGMRQTEAHDALRRFLHTAVSRGHRNVLVITGKGRQDDDATPWSDQHTRPQRGVLRRSVPLWLSGPEFGGLVAGFTTAHFRHGGEGAFYVQLRRAKKTGKRG